MCKIPDNVIWRWVTETKPFEESDTHWHDDIASEYLIEGDINADCGVILWAKYRGVWEPNPFSSRAVIAKLLSECGVPIEIPKRTERNKIDVKVCGLKKNGNG